jgi:hypothetical protein
MKPSVFAPHSHFLDLISGSHGVDVFSLQEIARGVNKTVLALPQRVFLGNSNAV